MKRYAVTVVFEVAYNDKETIADIEYYFEDMYLNTHTISRERGESVSIVSIDEILE